MDVKKILNFNIHNIIQEKEFLEVFINSTICKGRRMDREIQLDYKFYNTYLIYNY